MWCLPAQWDFVFLMKIMNCITRLTEAGILYFRCSQGSWSSYWAVREAAGSVRSAPGQLAFDYQLAPWAGLGMTGLSLLCGVTSKASRGSSHHAGVTGNELPAVLSSETKNRAKLQRINMWQDFLPLIYSVMLCKMLLLVPSSPFFSSPLKNWSNVPSVNACWQKKASLSIAKSCNHLSVSIMVLTLLGVINKIKEVVVLNNLNPEQISQPDYTYIYICMYVTNAGPEHISIC